MTHFYYHDRDEWYLKVDKQCSLYVTEYGTGKPIVGLHGGWGAEHSYLVDAFRGLENRYRIVLYDQRGSLRSPGDNSSLSLEDHIEDLDKLRKELKLDKITIVEHSMGSFLAMAYLKKYPENVKGLILISSSLPRQRLTDSEIDIVMKQQKILELQNKNRELLVAQEIKKAGLDKPNLSDKEKTYRWRIQFASYNLYDISKWRKMRGGQVFYNSSVAEKTMKTFPENWDYTECLAHHPYPITIINEDNGLKKEFDLHKLMLHGLPNIEIINIRNAGHNIWIDQPDTFRKELIRALEKYSE